ncbi:DUF3887 domain-containing protein [Nocardia terpenica]|uniref:DUF3887 domain-containing protein n=1 Tax=Nocardia terpenica TaxID=455432 RepID=A0A164NX78_9NOCA|nr:DUF3887 domain-containing protein [Nocardia terpenica]KZM74833.1 hypothetical protein AWN90_22640 [Nocardia terpenica]NQE93529.1 DUF3887 domain-containing protein [Nocardia terpenica]
MAAEPASPLTQVASARDTARAAENALRAAVDRAREAGHTWQEIGEVLGTSRQAAFQRFGRHIDPQTGAVVPREAETVRPELAEHAMALIAAWSEQRWAEVRRDFDDRMARELSEDLLARAWGQTVGMVGRYEHAGEPFVRQAGVFTVVFVPLQFEAAEMTGQVFYDDTGKVAGLFLKPIGSG